MKTLYLHAGTHKTATTTIQEFMKMNAELLSSKGYAYPIFPYKYRNKLSSRNGMFLGIESKNEFGERDVDEEKRRYDLAVNTIHELFKTHDYVVLSDESIWRNAYIRREYFRALTEDAEENGYTIKMIIYLRRQDSFIESMWNQKIKSAVTFRMSMDEYIEEGTYSDYLDYLTILDYYAGIIGEDNMIIRRFSDAIKAEGGILADFLQTIGLELTEEYTLGEDKTNIGLYGNEVRIMQLVNQIEGMTHDEHRLFRESFVMCSPNAKEEYPCSEFSEEERVEFMSRFEEGNRKLAEKYLHDGRPLFSEKYSGKPKREDSNPFMQDDIVRSMAATDLVLSRRQQKTNDDLKILAEKVKELQKQVRDLEKQNRKLEKQAASHERRIFNLRHPLHALIARIKKLFAKDEN